MLTSFIKKSDYKVVALQVGKEHGPFYCPECEGETIVKKGTQVIHHFAHKVKCGCSFGAGESQEHLNCKQSIYLALLGAGFDAEMEKDLGEVRADVYFITRSGLRVVIEIQRSDLTVENICHRTMAYTRLGVYVLWVKPNDIELTRHFMNDSMYTPKAWERWIYAAYEDLLYTWSGGLDFLTYKMDVMRLYKKGGYDHNGVHHDGYHYNAKKGKSIDTFCDLNLIDDMVLKELPIVYFERSIFVPKRLVLIGN